MSKFGQWAVLFLIGIPQVFVGGLVVSIFWGWFIAPVFHVPALTPLHAVGVNFVAATLTRGGSGDGAKKDLIDYIAESVVWITIYWPATFVFGWLWHLVIGAWGG